MRIFELISNAWLLAAPLLLAVPAGGDTRGVGDDALYEWQPGEIPVALGALAWTPIAAPRLAGFEGRGKAVEKAWRPYADEGTPDPCPGGAALRTEGGLLQVKYRLELGDGQNPKVICTAGELAKVFSSVQSETQAMSFVAVTVSDLAAKDGVLEGATAGQGKNFLVQVVRKNTFGCGTHIPIRAIYRVTPPGSVKLIASEKPKPRGSGVELCVD